MSTEYGSIKVALPILLLIQNNVHTAIVVISPAPAVGSAPASVKQTEMGGTAAAVSECTAHLGSFSAGPREAQAESALEQYYRKIVNTFP